MELQEHAEGGAASLKPAAAGPGLPMGFTFKTPTLTKLSTDASGVPGASGVLTISDDIACTNASLRAREEALSQAAVCLVRNAPENDAAGGMKASPVIDAARVEAEISTLELLNQRDTMLCDDLRASCRIDAPKISGGVGVAGGGLSHNNKASCWARTEGVGVPKQGLSSSVPGAPLRRHDKAGCESRRGSDGGGVESGDGDDDGADGGSESRKRVFSKYDEETTSILTEWFLAHKRWPYPAAKEKDALAEATKLTTLQISNWFTNKRKRHWTPVIKKRTRSPRDFFEFCVMNPKEQTLTGKKLPAPHHVQQQQQHQQHQPQQSHRPHHQQQQQQQPPNMAMGGTNSYAPGDLPQRGMGPSNGMHHRQQMPSGSGIQLGAAHDMGVKVNGNGASGMPFEPRSSGPVDGAPGNRAALPGMANDGGWLDHSHQQHQQQQLPPPPQQQQPQQNQPQQQGVGVPQHPGALAPGLVYAASKASRAAQVDPPSRDQHMPSWMNPPGKTMERRGHSMIYPHGGFRTGQQGGKGPPLSSINSLPPPPGVAPRDPSRIGSSSVPQYGDVRGFDASNAYHQAQQNHEALRRRDQTPGAPQPLSQQGPSQQPMGQQQHLPPNPDGQQYQQQQQQQLPSNPAGSSPSQTSSSMPASPAQQAASSANPNPWVSYRAPSPRNLTGPPTFSQPRVGNGGAAGGGDHAPYPPSSYYAQGTGGSETTQYSSAPPNPIAGGSASGGGGGGGGGGDGYGAWRGSSSGARQESFPPVAAFASSGGSGAGGVGGSAAAGVSGAASGGGGGLVGIAQRSPDPVHSSPDVRVPHQSFLQRQQQQQSQQQQSQQQQQQQPRGSPIDGASQKQQQQQQQPYWDRPLSGRGWPAAGSEVAPLHPPPRTASSEFTRAPTSSGPATGESSVAASPSQSSPIGVRAGGAATAASAGWR